MRLKYARFKGYIGFYNGLDGLDELKIDFTKAKHKVCIITGKNGSGKSTLEKALSTPLPDNSSSFVPNMTGEKELHIIDNGDLYELLMVSPISSNGTRGQTKAYIRKNGKELNENGNVTSYKDIVYTEFELDPSYMTLCRISGDDRGIADKSPAERKKFVSVIISALENYNAMNKTLTKKSNIFKSYINNLDIKIKNIGDEQALYASEKDIDNRYRSLSDTKIRLEKEKTEAETFINISDPNNTLQDKYQLIYDGLKNINDTLESKEKQLEELSKSLSDINIDKIEDENIRVKNLIIETENKIAKSMDEITRQSTDREEKIRDLSIQEERIKNIENDFDIDSLTNAVESIRKTVLYQESIFTDSQIANFNTSKDEFVTIFQTLQDIKYNINVFQSHYNKSDIDYVICMMRDSSAYNINSMIASINEEISDLKLQIKEYELEINKYETDISTMKILEQRPKKCNINSCPLIVNALEIEKQLPMVKLKETQLNLGNTIKQLKTEIGKLDTFISNKIIIDDLLSIISSIESRRMILDKVPMSIIFTDTEELLTRIENCNNFNEIGDVQKYIEMADDIADYRENKDMLIKLESELKANENKISVLKELKEIYEETKLKIDTLKDSIEKLRKDKIFNEEILNKFRSNASIIETLYNLKIEISDMRDEKIKLKEEYLTIKDNISKIKSSIDRINTIASDLSRVSYDLEPLQEQKEKIRFSLTTLESYKQELDMYKEKFDITNILKKYSSPTAGGIQTLYMNIYMSKTLSMANELLSMIFSGEYKLLPYVINATEFRIPFMGNGLEVDDISSGSTSQICMMGMVMNLVLFYQASTKFNIVFLDEPDGGLDSHNRYEFIAVLFKMIDILKIDQLIMISHSIEMEMSNVDVIRLKGYEEDEDHHTGNIIYQYGKD